ncbi:MAG: hypothetical protein ACFCUR_20230 [Rhodomicrobiaceae bacterium]
MRSVSSMKNLIGSAGIVVLTLALLDAVLFFALPASIAAHFSAYREGSYVIDMIGRGYPRDYFDAHAERGFDIKPTDLPRTDQIHAMDEYSYPVWSNKLGCFDRPIKPEKMNRFWYMAGDSIAWGHAKFEDLMGTVVETAERVEIMQCGVTHTGQRHQFSKFLEISKMLGRWPERVLVFYSPTDTANDYLHPHSSVIDGGLADVRMLGRNNEIVNLDQGWFDQISAQRDAARPSPTGQPTTFSLARFLMQYSMSAQILNAGLHRIADIWPWYAEHVGVLGEDPGVDWHDKYYMYKGKKLYDLHRLTHIQTEAGLLRYATFEYAENNKKVIREWRDHARAHGYKLEFVLPHPGPPRAYDEASVTNFYKEFIAYLTSLDLKYYNLIQELEKREIDTEDLYWEEDIHMSGRGNRVVGKILAELL